MTRLRVTVMYIIALICQMTLAGIISISNVGPNLILCLTVVIIFVFDDGWKCFPYALVTALLLDICVGSCTGAASLSLTFTILLAYEARKILNTEQVLPMFAAGACCTLLYDFVYWIIMKIAGDPMTLLFMLKYQLFYIIYNVIIMYFLFRYFDRIRIRRELEEDEVDI
ncbi:MAG: rod shape-determining protein MreD [Anaerovoracaceae bacterium]|nr:rod shape-determining protein MreD [Anaerovoracaceae bacterium]